MFKVVLPILGLLYFCGGAGIGSIVFALAQKRGVDFMHGDGVLVLLNTILLPTLVLFWHRRHSPLHMEPTDPDFRAFDLVIHHCLINVRIALVLASVTWITGLFVAIVFGF
jgi:hypothetical protein